MAAKMYVRHKVADFKKWKTVFDEVHNIRVKFGSTGEHVFCHHQNPNEVLIITEWSNKEQAKKYGQSTELKQAMERAGVTSIPDISFGD